MMAKLSRIRVNSRHRTTSKQHSGLKPSRAPKLTNDLSNKHTNYHSFIPKQFRAVLTDWLFGPNLFFRSS